MSMKIMDENGMLVIQPLGAMNAVTSAPMQEEIRAAVEGSDSKVVLDLSDVPFVSSQGLRVVIRTAKLAAKTSTLVVCGLRSQIRQMFELAGVDRIVEIRDGIEEPRHA